MEKREKITTISEIIKIYDLPIKFKYYDPNPNKNKTFPEINDGELMKVNRWDCSTRAICAITEEEYDVILSKQMKLAMIYKISYNHVFIISLILKEYGYEMVRIFKTTGLLFILKNPIGKYLLCAQNHAYTVIDGCIYDNFINDEAYPSVDTMLEDLLMEKVKFIFRKTID